MIVDSSAIIAIILDESDAERLLAALGGARRVRMSAVNWFESAMVAESKGGLETAARFDRMIAAESIEVVELTPEQARLARVAWQRYGKGRHPASLNFGDCMAYALARESGEPLLFKGNDFIHTDIIPAPRD